MNPSIAEQRKGLGTWLEIDRSALAHNYNEFRRIIAPGSKFCAVLKSNAYGHDFMAMAHEMLNLGVDWIAVGNVTEGLRLRAEGVKIPILILYYTLPESIKDAVEADLSLTISQFESLEFLGSQTFSKKPKIHIEIDTGMHRTGFMHADYQKLFETLKKYPNIEVEGVYSHFAAAGNPAHIQKTKKQISDFVIWKDLFIKQGFKPMFHLAASSGSIIFPETHFDMVRIGIGLYGVWPSTDVMKVAEKKISLKPILSWKTMVSEIKHVTKGEMVGYDFTHAFDRDSVLAIAPMGYWHGFPRALSNMGEVLVGGMRVRVVGRVSMSMIILDITDINKISPVKVQDEVVLIGSQGNETLTAMTVAMSVQMSWYEFLTRLNPLMKRIFF